MGVDFRQLSPQQHLPEYEQLPFFVDIPSADNGNLIFTQALSNIPAAFSFRNLGVYAQDTWRILPTLTLTYGLRWDVDFTLQSINGPNFPALTNFNVHDLSSLSLASMGIPPYKTGYGNVAPRLGLAYQLSRAPAWQTVLRGGLGTFYDLVDSETGNGLGSHYPFGAVALIRGGTFPLLSAPPAPPIVLPSASNPSVLIGLDPNLKAPYSLEWNFAVEQALGKDQTISASYVGSVGRRLLQTVYVQSPTPELTGSSVLAVTNPGTSDYHSLQIQFQRRLSHRFQALASYTLSHSIDTGSAGSNNNFSDLVVPGGNQNLNRGPSDFDIRHSVSAGLTYDVPAPKLKPFTNAILRGWSTDNFVMARSAQPVDVSDANFSPFNESIVRDIRPDRVLARPLYLYGSQYAGGRAFNPAAFRDPPADAMTGNPLRQGTTPRNLLRGFGAVQWDFAVHRDFPVRESIKLQFRAEIFNVLNHPNFGPPSGQFGSGGFGVSNQLFGQTLSGGNVGGGALSPLYQLGGPRSIQFALKLFF